MAKYAIIENGAVINTIVAEEDFIANHFPSALLCEDEVCPGWAHDGENFYIPPQPEFIPNAETL